jgi:UDP-glucuronate 4-epimerase
MKILVTGAAGFIGYHLCRRLVQRGDQVVGIDNLNEYYDVRIKRGRLGELGISAPPGAAGPISSTAWPNLRFEAGDIENAAFLESLFRREGFDRVCNLAAQAGVRYSLTNPGVYVSTNIGGFLNVLEACRAHRVEHLVYASSSSVYGIDRLMPFGETGAADHPASLYAASKRANELMAHSYSHLFGIPTTGLRFFTVYGPWGRPDMALFIFTKAMTEGRPIDVYNNGNMQRDFTYVDDIVEGVVRVLDTPPRGDPAWDGRQSAVSPAPCRVYNIGNGAPVNLMDFIVALEHELGVVAKKNLLPAQPGDVAATWADCAAIERDFGFRPRTGVAAGIREFVRWYRGYFGPAK